MKSREIKEENCRDYQARIIHWIGGKIDYTIILTACKMITTLVVCRKIGKRKEKKVSIFCSIGGRVYGSRSNRDIRSLWNFMLTYGTCIFHGFIIISHLGLRNAKFLEWAFYRFCRSEIRARSANNKSNIRVTETYFVSRHTLNTMCLYISKKES